MEKDVFRDKVKKSMYKELGLDIPLLIQTKDSAGTLNIQIADWIVGGIARYITNKRLGNEAYTILKPSIIGIYEMFGEYKKPR